jgi:hypothetical protein
MGISSRRMGSRSHSSSTSTAVRDFAFQIIREGSRGASREKARYLPIGVSLPRFHEGADDAPKSARPLGGGLRPRRCLANEGAELLAMCCVAHDHLESLSCSQLSMVHYELCSAGSLSGQKMFFQPMSEEFSCGVGQGGGDSATCCCRGGLGWPRHGQRPTCDLLDPRERTDEAGEMRFPFKSSLMMCSTS